MDPGAILRETRLKRGLTQAQLARRSSTTQSYIGRVERGEVSPSLATLQRLLYAMGHRLTTTVEPLPAGNQPTRDLRADFERPVGERIRDAIGLSEWATGLAARTEGHR